MNNEKKNEYVDLENNLESVVPETSISEIDTTEIKTKGIQKKIQKALGVALVLWTTIFWGDVKGEDTVSEEFVKPLTDLNKKINELSKKHNKEFQNLENLKEKWDILYIKALRSSRKKEQALQNETKKSWFWIDDNDENYPWAIGFIWKEGYKNEDWSYGNFISMMGDFVAPTNHDGKQEDLEYKNGAWYARMWKWQPLRRLD